MKRLYYLTQSLDSVSQISDDLHREGLSDWNIHVLSKDAAGLYHRHIHEAHLFQQNDVIHSGEMGALIGALIGLFIALSADFLLPLQHSLPMLVLAAIAATFTFFGAWSGGLVGITRENYKVRRFHDDLEKGQYLIMVDVLRQQEILIKQQINRYHPEALLAAQGSSWIQPFSYNFWFASRKA
jgi:hypothetical protein